MSPPVRSQNDIAPGLLIAMPQLRDPNFYRSVVLMLEHNEDGSFGVVINHLVSATITMQAQAEEPEAPVVDKVYLGGPVSPQVCMVVHGGGWRCEKSQEIVSGLLVSEPSASVPFLMKQDDVPYRFIMGYAGWGPGQLSSEMASGAWLCAPVTAGLVLDVEAKDQWQAVIRHLGIDPMMLVPASSTQ